MLEENDLSEVEDTSHPGVSQVTPLLLKATEIEDEGNQDNPQEKEIKEATLEDANKKEIDIDDILRGKVQ